MGSRAGKPNKATATREAAHERAGLTPLMYLLGLLRDETQEQPVRIDAAKAAAPYVHPRLSQVDAKLTGQIDIRGWLQSLGEPES